MPANYRGALPDLMARLEPLPVSMGGQARVVINERTGTVVVGGDVRLGPHRGRARQPVGADQHEVRRLAADPVLAAGRETVVVPDEKVDVNEADAKLVTLDEGATLDAVVRALNALGATPRDIIAIMQALKAAGALSAELVIL